MGLFALGALLGQGLLTGGARAQTVVVICHMPGTPAEQTLAIPPQALNGHLRHGDTLGPCEGATTETTPTTTETTPTTTETTPTTTGTTPTTTETTPTTTETTPTTTETTPTTTETTPTETIPGGGAGGGGSGGGSGSSSVAQAQGELPFTGLPVWALLLTAGGLLTGGLLLLRRGHGEP
jgi:hypothetical protein